jgi:hypothetical protein
MIKKSLFLVLLFGLGYSSFSKENNELKEDFNKNELCHVIPVSKLYISLLVKKDDLSFLTLKSSLVKPKILLNLALKK